MKSASMIRNISPSPGKEPSARLTAGAQASIERIVSHGHASPAEGWYDQDCSEWVLVLRGEARLPFEDRSPLNLCAGDYIASTGRCRTGRQSGSRYIIATDAVVPVFPNRGVKLQVDAYAW